MTGSEWILMNGMENLPAFGYYEPEPIGIGRLDGSMRGGSKLGDHPGIGVQFGRAFS